MNEDDKQTIQARYRARLAKHGPGIEALASGTVARRRLRFDVLASIGDLHGASVLDLGCGLGDFHAHLRERGIDARYTGYDITPEFVDAARALHPDARFEWRDVQLDGIAERFDYIVSSQTFNNRLRHEDNVQLVRDILRICLEASNKGIAIDLLTSYVDYREDHLFYYSPEEMFRYAKSLTKRVALRHDQPLYEFALFLYKDFNGWNA